MDEAKAISEWQQASFVAAYSANANPYLKRPVSPKDINPLKLRQSGTRITKENFGSLKALCRVSQ